MARLPVGKLPPELMRRLLAQAPQTDERILLGPGVGLDCAVVDLGDRLLVFKSDPITFATSEIGWYAVQVNANDLATTGAAPRWLLATLLLPEGAATSMMAESIFSQVHQTCAALGVSVLGGHTEVTFGLNRPLLAVTMIGEVSRAGLITPRGARAGDRLLLTKGVPIEATALLAREMPHRLAGVLNQAELELARQYLVDPGIGITTEARLAVQTGGVTAMHDPTEGGLAAALWELCEASGKRLVFDPAEVPVPKLAGRICTALGIDPLAAIASGALLLTARPDSVTEIITVLGSQEIACACIGRVEAGPVGVWQNTLDGLKELSRPERDEVARLFADGAVDDSST